MSRDELLAERFESHRDHMRSVAYRMLGSTAEADDAVQEAWVRLSRADASGIENLGGWLTTVVARVCLDTLRSRRSRREEPLDHGVSEPAVGHESGMDPEHEALLADSVGLALIVVLEKLAPAERVAFVLHDMFDLPFADIATIVGRSPEATRQLASRARRRVRGTATVPDSDVERQRQVVQAFHAASRAGNFDALLELLDPEVVLRADPAAVIASAARQAAGAPAPKLAPEVRGAAEVAETFAGRAGAAQPALVNGTPGLVWAPGGQPRAVFGFKFSEGRIVEIGLVFDPERNRQLDVVLLGD